MMGTRPAADVVCGASELPQDSHHQAYMQALQGSITGPHFVRAANVKTCASASQSSIDSFRRGDDSPDSMASLTICVPRTSDKSAGIVVSVF